jgi:hypothetical protein
MRKAIVSIIALAVLVCAADHAQAVSNYIKLGKRSVGQIKSACGSSFGVHDDGGGYGCVKENCDGKGGQCGVSCDNKGNCTGWHPARTTSKNFLGVLTGGQLAQPGTPANRPPKPVTSQGALGSSILDGGSGFGAQGPASTGSPAGGGAAPPRAQGGRVN